MYGALTTKSLPRGLDLAPAIPVHYVPPKYANAFIKYVIFDLVQIKHIFVLYIA
jgi:hypothetical protein